MGASMALAGACGLLHPPALTPVPALLASAGGPEDEFWEEPQEPGHAAVRELCAALASAVVLRRCELAHGAAAQLAALPAAPFALCLDLASERCQGGLEHHAVVEGGRLVRPSHVAEPGAHTAARSSFESRRCLVWRRSLDGPAPEFEDWHSLLQQHPGAQALLTVPLALPGGGGALGAATLALGAEPSASEEAALRALASALAGAIAHATKNLWEESLEFLAHVVPRRALLHMALAGSLPLSSGGGAQMTPAVACTEGGPAEPSVPACASARSAAKGSCGSSSGGSSLAAPTVVQLGQKWTLEFLDPLLEESFKHWFNAAQTQTDLAVMRYIAVLVFALLAALALRGHLTVGDVVAITHGLLSVAALAVVMALGTTRWYVAHRSEVVAGVRIAATAVLLLHCHLDPGFYSGSLLKALAGSCVLTLATQPLRNRLRFSNHLLVQLAKLNLCATASAFAYSDPRRAAAAYLPLPAACLLQLAAAALPSLAVYRLEAAARREFVRSRLVAAAAPALTLS